MALKDALQMVSLSDPGMVRELNEDSVAIRAESGIAVLADGMGGYNAGEVASQMAVSIVADGLAQGWQQETWQGLERDAVIARAESVLQQQIQQANADIFTKAQQDAACEGMGTTLVACLFHDNFITVGHIGDSRLYRLRGDVLEQLTRDHSVLQEQIDAGMLRKEDAHQSNNRNLLTRAVGIASVEIAETHTYEVLEEDLFLICSDGLFGMISDEEIELTLASLKANLGLAANQLVQAANDAGGTDNVSVILVRIMKSFPAGAV